MLICVLKQILKTIKNIQIVAFVIPFDAYQKIGIKSLYIYSLIAKYSVTLKI